MIAPDKGQPPIVLHVRTIEPVESFVLAAAPSERLSGLIGATVGKSRNLLLQSLQRFGPMSKRVFSHRYPGELIAAPGPLEDGERIWWLALEQGVFAQVEQRVARFRRDLHEFVERIAGGVELVIGIEVPTQSLHWMTGRNVSGRGR